MSVTELTQVPELCLNPCCNGIYSMSVLKELKKEVAEVLILVVMEYTQ